MNPVASGLHVHDHELARAAVDIGAPEVVVGLDDAIPGAHRPHQLPQRQGVCAHRVRGHRERDVAAAHLGPEAGRARALRPGGAAGGRGHVQLRRFHGARQLQPQAGVAVRTLEVEESAEGARHCGEARELLFGADERPSAQRLHRGQVVCVAAHAHVPACRAALNREIHQANEIIDK